MAVLLSTPTNLSSSARFNLLNNNIGSFVATLSCHFSDPRRIKKRPCLTLVVKNHSVPETAHRDEAKFRHRKSPVLSEGRDEDDRYGPICPGCGVFMQEKDPNRPGYYKKREVSERKELADDEDDFEEGEAEEEGFFNELEDEFEESDEEGGVLSEGDELEWESDDWEKEVLEEDDDELKELDGFGPAGVGYGNITEETVQMKENMMRKKNLSKSERKKLAREAQKEEEKITVCARCHSLRNYGQVKNQAAENLIPDFDFDHVITTRLMKPTGNANSIVVLMVVDCVDFDGSFPKRASKTFFKALEGAKDEGKLNKKLPKLVLVATKVDLLPSEISPARLDKWVRHRAKAAGAPKLSGVYLVSAKKDLGMKNLLSFIKELAGPRGNVWVIGAQNAGKSTLINAMAKKGGAKVTKLTEAPIPGTTLGILRIGGILSAKAKMYDTPGLLHPYLMSMRLNREEQKMVEVRKELQSRTYRVKAGQTVHVGGLVRLDLVQASVETIYISIWGSPNFSLHLGKTENADETLTNHIGIRLQPPIGKERASELGEWEAKEINVSGTSWDTNSVDISIAGLGWFSIGLKGEATLMMWTYSGIEITMREPLVLGRASFLERPGFWLPKAISEAIGSQTKIEARRKKELEEVEEENLLSEVSL